MPKQAPKQASSTSKRRSGVEIAPCTCKHEYQDKLYGKGMRVWTRGGTVPQPQNTCTVCGATSK